MAEVVKVPIIGNVKTPWLYAGGAAIAGIVGYAWWTRGSTAAEDEGFSVELPVDEYAPPTVVDSGISVGGGQSTAEPIARTNIEWRNMAQAEGEALGFSQTVVQSALTKYLGKARLSVTEAACMSAIVAILGQPPTGGPYSIMLESVTPPPPHEPPPTQPPPTQPPPTQPPPTRPPGGPSVPTTVGPVAVNVEGGDRYGVFFAPTPGATQYRLRWEQSGAASGWVSAAPGSMGYAGTYTWRFGQPQKQFAVRVQAGNAAGWDPNGAVSAPVYSRP